MPSHCALTDSGAYAVKHNPEAYYTSIRAAVHEQTTCQWGRARAGSVLTALEAGTLPAFSFVTPNLCNDMHDCSVQTATRGSGHGCRRSPERELQGGTPCYSSPGTRTTAQGGNRVRYDRRLPLHRARAPEPDAVHPLLAAAHDRGAARHPRPSRARRPGPKHALCLRPLTRRARTVGVGLPINF